MILYRFTTLKHLLVVLIIEISTILWNSIGRIIEYLREQSSESHLVLNLDSTPLSQWHLAN